MEQLMQHEELIISAASKTSVTGSVEWPEKIAEIKATAQEVNKKAVQEGVK